MNDKTETKTSAEKPVLQVMYIPIDQIISSPHQARKTFNEDAIKVLAESMQQEGLIQPITVRLKGEGREEKGETTTPEVSPITPPPSPLYELISGERRLRAAKSLGWQSIDARIIQTISPGESAAKGLIENLQREDLNPIEEAEGFDHLNKLSPDYWDQKQIAKVTGRTQGYISQSISLLKLAPEIQDNIRRLIYSRSLGLELGRLEDPLQQLKVAKVIGKNPTVKKLRKHVDQELGWKSRKVRKKGVPDPLANVWSQALADPEVAPECAWKVEYREEAWQFSFSPHTATPIESLYDWLDKIRQSLEPIAKKHS